MLTPDRQTDRRTDRQTDGRTDRQMNGWTDGLTDTGHLYTIIRPVKILTGIEFSRAYKNSKISLKLPIKGHQPNNKMSDSSENFRADRSYPDKQFYPMSDLL